MLFNLHFLTSGGALLLLGYFSLVYVPKLIKSKSIVVGWVIDIVVGGVVGWVIDIVVGRVVGWVIDIVVGRVVG